MLRHMQSSISDALSFYLKVLNYSPYKGDKHFVDWLSEKRRKYYPVLLLQANDDLGSPYADFEILSIVRYPLRKYRKVLSFFAFAYWPIALALFWLTERADIYGTFIIAALLYVFLTSTFSTGMGSIAPYLFLVTGYEGIANFYVAIPSFIFGFLFFIIWPYMSVLRPKEEFGSLDLVYVALFSILMVVITDVYIHVVNLIFINLARRKLIALHQSGIEKGTA